MADLGLSGFSVFFLVQHVSDTARVSTRVEPRKRHTMRVKEILPGTCDRTVHQDALFANQAEDVKAGGCALQLARACNTPVGY